MLPEEHERAQPFEIDLDVQADLSEAGRSDALADTLDYAELAGIAAGIVAGEHAEHADLIEHLAARIADAILVAAPAALAVTVTVRKLRPPVPLDLASAAVTITRQR